MQVVGLRGARAARPDDGAAGLRVMDEFIPGLLTHFQTSVGYHLCLSLLPTIMITKLVERAPKQSLTQAQTETLFEELYRAGATFPRGRAKVPRRFSIAMQKWPGVKSGSTLVETGSATVTDGLLATS